MLGKNGRRHGNYQGKGRFSLEKLNSQLPASSWLKAIGYAESIIGPNGGSCTMVECICKCGNIKTFRRGKILTSSLSCGCKRSDPKCAEARLRSHKYPKAIKNCYHSFMSRCYNKKCIRVYKNYGGRGVIVCDEWRNDKYAFCKWALENGWSLGLQLDKDIKGDGMIYSPETCCWVTPKINGRNRRMSIKVKYKGEEVSLIQLAEIAGVGYDRIYRQIVYAKKSAEKTLEDIYKLKTKRSIYFMVNEPSGKDLWYAERLSKFTASEIYKLLTYSKDNLFSKGAFSYIKKKAIEACTCYWENEQLEFVKPLLWGKRYEQPAFEAYIKYTGFKDMRYFGTENPIFLTYNQESGGSPDGLLGDGIKIKVGLELKCPFSSSTHFDYHSYKNQWDLKDNVPEYYAQIQFLLMITKSPLWHWVSFDERFKEPKKRIKLIEVESDSRFQNDLEIRILQAIVERNKMVKEFLST